MVLLSPVASPPFSPSISTFYLVDTSCPGMKSVPRLTAGCDKDGNTQTQFPPAEACRACVKGLGSVGGQKRGSGWGALGMMEEGHVWEGPSHRDEGWKDKNL